MGQKQQDGKKVLQMSQNSPHSKSPPGQTVSPINLSFVILGNHSLLWRYLPCMPGNGLRKALTFPEIPGNPNG